MIEIAELRTAHEHLRLGKAHDVLKLAAAKVDADGHGHRAKPLQGKEHDGEFDPIGQLNRDHVALGDTERTQSRRHTINGLGELTIAEAARAIALAEGWSNVTMRKIADRIEYSHAAIYDYFENKDVLLLELVHEGFRLLEADLKLARAQAHDPEEAMRLIAHGYLEFAWRYPELYRLMYCLDGVTFRTAEPEKEGLRIEDAVAQTVKDVLDSHGWSTEHLADQVNILWGTAHGLVALTLADRIRGGQAQAVHLFDRAIQEMLLAWEQEVGTAHSPSLPNR